MHFVKFKADEALAKHVLTTEGFPRSKELPPCICLKVICLSRPGLLFYTIFFSRTKGHYLKDEIIWPVGLFCKSWLNSIPLSTEKVITPCTYSYVRRPHCGEKVGEGTLQDFMGLYVLFCYFLWLYSYSKIKTFKKKNGPKVS